MKCFIQVSSSSGSDIILCLLKSCPATIVCATVYISKYFKSIQSLKKCVTHTYAGHSAKARDIKQRLRFLPYGYSHPIEANIEHSVQYFYRHMYRDLEAEKYRSFYFYLGKR